MFKLHNLSYTWLRRVDDVIRLNVGRKMITGSFIGSMIELEEMLEFCKDKNLTSTIETVKMDYINTAFERLEKNDVRYRFVVDVAGSKMEQ